MLAQRDDSRLRELLLQAAEKPGPQQAGFLESACRGEPELRREVESLLSALGRDDVSLAPIGLSPHESAPEAPGQQIGRYALRRLIGEGGFGSVFLAHQEQPVRRDVALKVIKLGMDTRQVVARFEAERQALAMMDHPNVARVLDAGATSRSPT